jgi:hypothetical protein
MTDNHLTVRVWVPDVWDNLVLPVSTADTFGDIKARGLTQATGRAHPAAAEYLIKYRGALVTDETRTLGDLEVPDGAPMIILPAHRRPVV